MAVFNAAYRCMRVNAALAEMCEGTPEELLERPYRDLVHPDQYMAMAARMRASDAGSAATVNLNELAVLVTDDAPHNVAVLAGRRVHPTRRALP